MRLTQMQELVLVAVLIGYIAFTPGIPMVRMILSTSIGKAVGLAAIVYTWKSVSALVALLLTVVFVRCSGMREGVDATLSTPSAKTCPSGFTPKEGDPGKCTKKDGSTEIVVDAQEAPKATPAPPASPEPKKEEPKAPTELTIPEPPPVETFVPNMKEPMKGGCAFSPL